MRIFWRRRLPEPLSRIAITTVVVVLIGAVVGSPRGNSVVAASTYDWPQFGFDAQHSGNDRQEAQLSAGNVNGLQKAFQASLPSTADGAPVYLSNLSTTSETKDLLFVTTTTGHIVALDARTGSQVWSKQYAANGCGINGGSSACYTTSSPALDPNRQYVYSYGLDGKVHKYQVGNGAEITTGGWPETVTLKDFDEKGSSALAIATAGSVSYLYVTNGGYPGDNGDYQGHVTAINLATGAQNVFNSLCSNQTAHFVEQPGTPDCSQVQSGIWARPGAVYDAATNRIYLATGNGDWNPSAHDWGDTVFALNPDGTGLGGNPLDGYTPTNFQSLQQNDLDLGSTDVAILPVPSGSNVAHLGVQGGKDAKLRLLNLDNLSGKGGPGNTGGEIATVNEPQGGEVLTQPAVWVDDSGTTWVFVANGSGISGLKLTVTAGTPGLQKAWQNGSSGTSPIVANGVLYDAASGTIQALDPTTGKQLWKGSIGGIHWQSPIVADGILYIADNNNHLTAFALPSYPTPNPNLTPEAYLPIVGN